MMKRERQTDRDKERDKDRCRLDTLTLTHTQKMITRIHTTYCFENPLQVTFLLRLLQKPTDLPPYLSQFPVLYCESPTLLKSTQSDYNTGR